MDWTFLQHALFSSETPALPAPGLMRVYLHLGWAIVLAWAGMLLGRRWPRPGRLALAGVLLAWALLPGPMSPAFWLGLAFQAPSLMSVVICLAWLLSRAMGHGGGADWALPDAAQKRALKMTGLAGVLLGWLLLLDTFAVLPFSLYAFGFSPAALGMAALAATLPWLIAGAHSSWRRVSLLLWSVLLLQVLLRLPTGNLWDALLDPWLWLALQLGWLLSVVRRLGVWRGSPATRA